MRIFLICNLFLSPWQAQASSILFQGTQSSYLDYRATLKAHADAVSPTQEYLDSHPLAVSREALLNTFAEAQKAFLEKSSEESMQSFKEVLNLLERDDWSASDREVFLHAYLRLAQLESDAGARDRWLSLSAFLGDDLKPDVSLFPPPLLIRRQELLRQMPRLQPPIPALLAGWDQILVNGRRCTRQDCGHWPRIKSRVRVTFLSDRWLPQSVVVDGQAIEHLNPRPIAWAEGSCEHPDWNPEAARFPSRHIFWSLACDKPEPGLNLQATSRSETLPSLPLPPKPRPFYESKWLWAGVGAAVAVFLVASNQKKESHETTPTTTYGN